MNFDNEIFNPVQCIIKEILAEGLEGITFEALWEYLSRFKYFGKIDDLYKQFIFNNVIKKLDFVEYYLLKTDRKINFKVCHRDEYFNYEKMIFLDEKLPYFQQHSLSIVNDSTVMGSCQDYESRVKLNVAEIHNGYTSYINLQKKYGNRLVIVADEECRMKFLGVTHFLNYVNKNTYAMLEIIARSRENGIASIGDTSLHAIINDPRSQWYIKTTLKKLGVIKTQKINILKQRKAVEIVIFHLSDFYKPFYNIFEKQVELVYHTISLNRCLGLNARGIQEVLGLSSAFCRAAEQYWLQKFETTYKALVKRSENSEDISKDQLYEYYCLDFAISYDNKPPQTVIEEKMIYYVPRASLFEIKKLLEELDSKQIDKTASNEENMELETNGIKKIELNQDRLDFRVIELLTQKRMNIMDMVYHFNVNKMTIKRVLKRLFHMNLLEKCFITVNKNVVVYYSIKNANETVDSMIDDKQLALCIRPLNNSVQNLIDSNLVNAKEINPRRIERQDYILDYLRSALIVQQTQLRRIIIEWERTKNITTTMDRKSLVRILADLQIMKKIDLFDVEFKVSDKTFQEKWICYEGIDESTIEFKEKYKERMKQLATPRLMLTEEIKSESTPKKVTKPKWYLKKEPDLFILCKDKTVNNPVMSSFKLPELPIMLKRKIFNEFLWYLCYGAVENPDLLQRSTYGYGGFQILHRSECWKKYVIPFNRMSLDDATPFTVNDIILQMPIYLLCLLTTIDSLPQDLFDIMGHGSLRWMTIGNLVHYNFDLVVFLINYKEKMVPKSIALLCESLINMGILSKRATERPVRIRYLGNFSMNRKVFLTDTRSIKLPNGDEYCWAKLPRMVWVINSSKDISDYWNYMYLICRNSKCAANFFQRRSLIPILNGTLPNNEIEPSVLNKLNSSGYVPDDLVSKITQLGCWLPHDQCFWENLGPCGFDLLIHSWLISDWYPNTFDRQCICFPEPYRSSFQTLRISLFPEEDDAEKKLLSSSIDDFYFHLLNEINLLIACAILTGEEPEELITVVRGRRWFATKCVYTKNYRLGDVIELMGMLTDEHVKTRERLVSKGKSLPIIKKYTQNGYFIGSFTVIGRQLMDEMIGLAEEEMSTMTNNTKIETTQVLCKLNESNQELSIYNNSHAQNMSLTLNDSSMFYPNEVCKRFNRPDATDSMENIIELTLSQYMLGCIPSFTELTKQNVNIRDTIIRSYPESLTVRSINSLKNFYVKQPIKTYSADLFGKESIPRLKIFGNKIIVTANNLQQGESVTYDYFSINNMISQLFLNSKNPLEYVNDGEIMPEAIKIPLENVSMKLFDLISDMFLFQLGLDKNCSDCSDNIIFHNVSNRMLMDAALPNKNKGFCKPGTQDYNRRLSMSRCRLSTVLKDAYLEIKQSAIVDMIDYVKNRGSNMESLKKMSEILPLIKNDAVISDDINNDDDYVPLKKKRPLTRSYRASIKEEEVTEDDSLLLDILNGKYEGRNYTELKKLYPDIRQLNTALKDLLNRNKVHLVGMNDFHFVADKYIRPWVIRIPDEYELDKENLKSRKRKRQSLTDRRCFIPAFYRNESGGFKYMTFKNVIESLYRLVRKNCLISLDNLIKEWSLCFGENALRQIVDILHKNGVVRLTALIEVGGDCDGGFFSKQPSYERIEPNVFDKSQSITVYRERFSDLSMINLMKHIGDFFQISEVDQQIVNLDDTIDQTMCYTVDEEEEEEAENTY